MMAEPLNILIIEDTEADYLLMQRRLRLDGLDCHCQRVDTFDGLRQALEKDDLDVVLADYNVPGMVFPETLAYLCARHPDLPVILVSGAIGEESAIDLFKAGLSDFVLKDRLARLLPAIERALDAYRAKRASQEAETRYRDLYNSIGDCICILGEDGRILEVNQSAEVMYGFARADFIGKSPSDLVAPGRADLLALLDDAIRRTLAGESLQYESWARRANGEIFPQDVNQHPGRYMGQRVVIRVERDITEREAAEHARRESEERLRLMTNSIMDYAIIMLDQQGRVISWNEGARRLKGYEQSDIIHKPFSVFYTPEDVDQGKPDELLDLARSVGRSEHEGWRVRADGSRFYANVVINAIRDDSGKLIGFSKITRDITERKAAEQRLRNEREQQETLRALLETTLQGSPLEETLSRCLERLLSLSWLRLIPKGGIFLADTRARELRLTASRNLSSEIMSLCAVVPWGRCHCGQAAAQGTMQYAQCVDARHEIRYPGMTDHGHYSLPLMSKGELLGVLVLYLTPDFQRDALKEQFLDSVAGILAGYISRARSEQQIIQQNERLEALVTERTADLEKAMLEAQRLARVKDNFLATMSHEIRTPMNALLGMMELVGLHGMTKEQTRMLEVARESGKSLLRIIDDILDYSKIEAGKLSIEPEPASIPEIMELTANFYSGMASAKGLGMAFSVSPEISPAVMVDRMRLRQVLNNFISNAIKFTDKGYIELRADLVAQIEGSETVRFSVSDTGIGIPEEAQKSLFQPFNQADSETTRKYGGTGLGLAICQRLAGMMGGGVTLDSEVGKGTTLTLTLELPVIDPELLRAAKSRGETPAPGFSRRVLMPVEEARARGVLILLVDDHPTNREVLTQQLNLLGYASEQATTSTDALRMWREGAYGMLVTDCHMPEMDGYQLTREIRRIEAETGRGHMPVLGWTANALREALAECLASGMDDLLVKPADLPSIEAKLNKLLPALTPSIEFGATAPTPVMPVATGGAERAALDAQVLAELTGGDKTMEAKMLARFKTSNQADAQGLREALAVRDAQAVARMAHRIKGASRMIGARAYSEACAALEQAGREGEWTRVEAGVAAFQNALDALEGLLEKY
jgi:PAS domain S-box-containing protein